MSDIQLLVAKHKQKAKEKEEAKDKKEAQKTEIGTSLEESSQKSFEELGVCDEICEAIKQIGYKTPSKIQEESLPYTLKGRDIIGLAETGSGKTASFAIPVI